jgi:hypothetical protein
MSEAKNSQSNRQTACGQYGTYRENTVAAKSNRLQMQLVFLYNNFNDQKAAD